MIEIQLNQPNLCFLPGQRIQGKVKWTELPSTSEHLDIRLIWYTTGKGTQDFEVVEKTEIKSPGATGQQSFDFVAPHRPYSFSGTLISLMWAIEVIVFPQQDAEQKPLAISPGSTAIVLAPLAKKRDKFSFFEIKNQR